MAPLYLPDRSNGGCYAVGVLSSWALPLFLLGAASPSTPPSSLTCYSTVFEPFVIEEDDGLSGADVELVRAIGQRLEIDIRVELMPWLRLEEGLRNRDPDLGCAFAFFDTEERRKYMDLLQPPLHVTEYVLFVRQRSPLQDATGDLVEGIGLPVGSVIAVNRGFQLPQVLADAAAADLITLHPVGEEEQSLRMVELGRVDAVLTNRAVGNYVLRRLKIQGVAALEPALTVRPAFLILADHGPRSALASGEPPDQSGSRLVERFEEALRELEADGTAGEIRDKYREPRAEF